jgi:tetraacyldisaccharide 4'-kinase
VGWRAGIEAGLARLWWQPGRLGAAQLLRPLAWCHAGATALRRAAYRSGWLRALHASVKVVVVGNLVAGGAGKTPTVIALVHALRRAGWTPGVISGGHGRDGSDTMEVTHHSSARQAGDEPLLICLRTGAPTWVARRRIDAARALCAAHQEVDVLLADDGLQHLQLARDAQVIVFDERGIGNGLQLPAGPLRQPQARRVPPHTHVLYNAPRASTPWPGAIAPRALGGAVLLQDWCAGVPATLAALHALRDRPLLAAAGMAAPQRFFQMLREAGLRFDALPLPDHFPFDSMPWPADVADVLVTEKDAVKLIHLPVGDTRIWVVTLDFQLPEEFIAALLHNLRSPQFS